MKIIWCWPDIEKFNATIKDVFCVYGPYSISTPKEYAIKAGLTGFNVCHIDFCHKEDAAIGSEERKQFMDTLIDVAHHKYAELKSMADAYDTAQKQLADASTDYYKAIRQ